MRDAKQVPLVVMTPKSLLRHPKAVSRPAQLADGQFEIVLDDPAVQEKENVHRVLLCSGKVYYDLLAEQEARNNPQIAIVRVEQLYPYPEWNLSRYSPAIVKPKRICWVQEEPQNMGTWNFISRHMTHNLSFGRSLRYIGRPTSASPPPDH